MAEPTAVADQPERAVVVASGLGARTRRDWIYRNVSATVRDGELGAIVGPAGSGRTSLLLAVAARMAFSAGSLIVCGDELPGRAARVRAKVAVARVGGVAELEPCLRVRDHLFERDGSDGDERFDKVCQRIGLTVGREALVGGLDAVRVTLLSVALAMLDEPSVVLVDDLDRGLPGADQAALWERMRSLTEDGTTVLATTTDREPLDGRADVVVDLGGDTP